MMLELLYPRYYANTLLEIPLEELKAQHIEAFVLDLDNTITEWNSSELRHEVEEWFKRIKAEGFKACILSNNGEQRIRLVADRLGIPFIHRAAKPRRGAFRRAIQVMGVRPEHTAVVGDQIFTDILGGNRSGLYTILVKPLARREFIGTKINRTLERFVLGRRLKKTPGHGREK